MTSDEKETLKAAKSGDVAALRRLITKDRALLKVRDKDGSTPLHCAAWKGHADAVGYLLEAGSGVNDANSNGHWGTTPLHAAAHGNQRAVAELLLDSGADPKIKNLQGRTPLEETTVHNASAVANLLRKYAAA